MIFTNTCSLCLTLKSQLDITGCLGLAVFVENENVTDWFTSANVADFKEYTCVSITKTNTTQIEVTYTTGNTSCSRPPVRTDVSV